MKVLHITQDLIGGGVTNVVINLIKSFHKLGVENVVVAPSIGSDILEQMNQYTTQLHLIGGSVNPINALSYVTVKLKTIKDLLYAEKPDIVIIQPGWLSLLSCFLSSVPAVTVVHGTYLNEIKYMWHHPLKGIEKAGYIIGISLSQAIETLQLRLASSKKNNAIVAVSRNTKKELAQLEISKDKVVSIINGVDKEIFKPMNKDYAKTLIEEMFGVKLENKVLLHINPGPRKGTHILLKAVAILRKIYDDNFTLLIVGRLGPKTYKEYVENMIRKFKLEYNVRLLGYVSDKKLPILYNAADLTVVPSYSEGAPLVIPESLACGTPIVATDVGGNSEYLKMVGMPHLLVTIEKYDFSLELIKKLTEALNKEFRIDTSLIPSWNEIALKYMTLIKTLVSS